MDNTLDNISIIKDDNIIKNSDIISTTNKIEKNNANLDINSNPHINSIDNVFDFEKSLELSNIEQKDEELKNNSENENNNTDINISLDYSFIIKQNKKNINENKNSVKKNKIRSVKTLPLKKIKKEDLDKIPLPIFSCIYCSNEIVSFKHLSNEIISNKYLLQTSIIDLKQLDYLISFQLKNDKRDNDNKLLDLVINYSEYLKNYYTMENIKEYFKLNNFSKCCQKNDLMIKKYFNNRFENNIIKKKKDFYFKGIKGINKITKNSINNKCLFNSTNSLINNYSGLTGFIGRGQGLSLPLAEKNNTVNQSNSSLLYFNSISINNNNNNNNNNTNNNNNEIGLIGKGNNLHYMENIRENTDKNIETENTIEEKGHILDFFEENDLKRKITKNDIEWETDYYDVYKPIIDDSNLSDDEKMEKNEKNENQLIKNKKNIQNSKHCFIISDNNMINCSKISLQNKKVNVCNNSKSLGSTNTSSNIILKNSVREKDNNKSISLLFNGNKILNIQSNNSAINANNNYNINIKNKLIPLSQFTNKSDKKLNICNRTPSFTKTRIVDLITNSEKKLSNKNGKSSIDLKNIHKKILFNYTANIKKAIVDNNINLKINSSMPDNKRNNNRSGTKINNHIQNQNISSIGNEPRNKYNKYNLLLAKPNINNDNLYDKTLFNKTTNGFNQLKKNKYNYNFNFFFKIKNNFEYCPFKPKIENKKQSSIISKNKNKNTNIKHYEMIDNTNNNNNINLRSLDKDNNQRKHYYNHIRNNHKSEKKVSFPRKLLSSHKKKETDKDRILAKKGKSNIMVIDLKNKLNN